jgi:hypothetical protein
VIVTPSGLTQVPWVLGALEELVVGAGVGVAVAVGEGLGDGLGDGLGLVVVVAVGVGEAVETVNVVLAVRELPAASVARALTLWLPAATPESGTLQLVVPDAACQAAPSTDRETALTPTLSDAVPKTVSDELVVLPLLGEAMDTDGAVVSTAVRLRLGAARVGAVAASASGTATEATTRTRTEVRTGVPLHWGQARTRWVRSPGVATPCASTERATALTAERSSLTR